LKDYLDLQTQDVEDLDLILGGKVPTSRTVKGAWSVAGGGALTSDVELKLTNDVETPAAWRFYGTATAAGARGWQALPGAGGSTGRLLMKASATDFDWTWLGRGSLVQGGGIAFSFNPGTSSGVARLVDGGDITIGLMAGGNAGDALCKNAANNGYEWKNVGGGGGLSGSGTTNQLAYWNNGALSGLGFGTNKYVLKAGGTNVLPSWGQVDWSELTGAPAIIPTTRKVEGEMSVAGGGALSADLKLRLVNDVTSPGVRQYYGTDANGTRNWLPFPGGIRLGHYAWSTSGTNVGLINSSGGLSVANVQQWKFSVTIPSSISPNNYVCELRCRYAWPGVDLGVIPSIQRIDQAAPGAAINHVYEVQFVDDSGQGPRPADIWLFEILTV
jgi:hypothetical protein